MRESVVNLINMGKLPPEDNDDVSLFEKYQELIESIVPPLSIEEADSLVLLLGNDGCYGLTSAAIHLIESSNGFRINDFNEMEGNYGIDILRIRASNALDIKRPK